MVQWIKTTLAAAGIDVKLFTTHPTQSTSNSNTKLHIPIEAILETEREGCSTVCIHSQNIIILNQ